MISLSKISHKAMIQYKTVQINNIENVKCYLLRYVDL